MGGCVILCMPAPLEATETLMPEWMDMDRIRYLFETRMRVRGNFHLRDCIWLSTNPGTNWKKEMQDDADIGLVLLGLLIELATDSYVTIFFTGVCGRFKIPMAPKLVTASRAQ